MAKTKKAKTDAQKSADAARAAYAKAKEAFDAKPDNANLKAAFDKAKTARDAAVKAENRERFLSVGTNRTKKARAAIAQLVKVANPKNYDFTAEEGEKIVAGIVAKVKEVDAAFKAAVGGSVAASADDFSL